MCYYGNNPTNMTKATAITPEVPQRRLAPLQRSESQRQNMVKAPPGSLYHDFSHSFAPPLAVSHSRVSPEKRATQYVCKLPAAAITPKGTLIKTTFGKWAVIYLVCIYIFIRFPTCCAIALEIIVHISSFWLIYYSLSTAQSK